MLCPYIYQETEMKRFLILAVILTAVLLTNTDQITAADPQLDNIAVYRVPVEARDLLVQMQAVVQHGKIDGDFIAELTPEQVLTLQAGGFTLTKKFDSPAEENRAWQSQPQFDEFHSYTTMLNDFQTMAAMYSSIAEYVVLGQSVLGRDIFALRISDNISVEEDEPEIGFWGCIHGNEYGAAEMPYMYAEYLLTNYGIDPAVTAYVDNNEIWCLPVTNPDGRVAGTRNNANNVDLNRDLGYNWDGWGSSTAPFSQPETQALRELCLENNFTLSVMYHCSGNEFYYPWGFFPNSAPDYNVLFRLGERYADMAGYAFMSSYQSYQTHGEVLDWGYGCFGQLSYTAEVSNSSSWVQDTFDRNRPGMNLYCSVAGEGIHGVVTDGLTGEPLEAAITISGSAIPCYTDAQNGDFHRVVLPGTYSVTAWANGYAPVTVNNVNVTLGTPGQADFALTANGGEHAFMVTSINQDDPNNSHNNRTYGAWALGESDNYPCSIGANGFIVLDMGEGHEISDGPGDDFTVTEAVFPRDSLLESYRVYAGDAVLQNTLIGLGNGTTSFDLSGTGVTSTRYLKIADNSGANPNEAFPGVDVDCITVLNGGEYIADAASEPPAVIPAEFSLSVYPNPFNAATTLSFNLTSSGKVNLKVFDISGREAASLVTGHWSLGQHSVVWNAEGMGSGVYFVRLDVLPAAESRQHTSVRKVVLVK